MIPASILLPIGLFLAGWSAENKLHWIATDIVRLILIFIGRDSKNIFRGFFFSGNCVYRCWDDCGFPIYSNICHRWLYIACCFRSDHLFFLIIHILIWNRYNVYSTCCDYMSAVNGWLWLPSVRSSHVRQTWIWDRMYGSCMPSYSIRMPCVSCLIHTHSFSFIYMILFFSPILFWLYGRRIRMSSKFAHKPVHKPT